MLAGPLTVIVSFGTLASPDEVLRLMSKRLWARLAAVGLTAAVALLLPGNVSCSKGAPPRAAFDISYHSGQLLFQEDYLAGTAPLQIQFIDRSAGEITKWRWSFGDGKTVEGSGEESRNPVHEYLSANNGYYVNLTVYGPGGSDQCEQVGAVQVLTCSEASVSELNQARRAIEDCLQAAGKAQLAAAVEGWDGRRGMVTAGGLDAADYLGIWKTFKAKYTVQQDGSISLGTDLSWGCVYWDPIGLLGVAGWVDKGVGGVSTSPLGSRY